MNRRALLAAVPSIALAGCATRLGIADRVEITRKFVRLHPWDGDEPIDAVVRRYDPDEGAVYDDDPHEAIADEVESDEPLVVSDPVADRLAAEYEIVEYRISACALDDDDCRETTLVREDFNTVEAGDVVDIVSRSSGAGLVNVHERREERD